MRILFLHGLEGSPTGEKPTWLRRAGHDVTAPTLDTRALIAHLSALRTLQDLGEVSPSLWALPLQTATAALAEGGFDVVVGSSFGGGLALELVRQGLWSGPTLVLAPAAKRLFGITSLSLQRLAILHGRGDDVVPLKDSLALAGNVEGDVVFRVVDDDHRLSASVQAGLMGALLQGLTA